MEITDYMKWNRQERTGIDIPANQLIVCSPYSETRAYCGNNIFPAVIMDTRGKLDPFIMFKTLEKIKKIYKNPKVELYGINLQSTDEYEVYPVEYIAKGKDRKKGVRVLDYYKENKTGAKDEVDSSAYFYDIFKTEANKISKRPIRTCIAK